jgi:hypothetical protein
MKWYHSMLTDGADDGISSKRAITVAAFILCAAGFVGDLLWDKKVDPNVYEAMMYIVIAGLGFTASEKFSRSKKEDNSSS